MAVGFIAAYLSLYPPIPAQAECVYVGPGNVSCVCNEGWTGDGKLCVEINNCQLESRGGCSPNANCNHIGPGQVSYGIIKNQLHMKQLIIDLYLNYFWSFIIALFYPAALVFFLVI